MDDFAKIDSALGFSCGYKLSALSCLTIVLAEKKLLGYRSVKLDPSPDLALAAIEIDPIFRDMELWLIEMCRGKD